MKKLVLFLFGLCLAFGAGLIVMVYRWSLTPYGRMHPLMGIIHKAMSAVPNIDFAAGDLDTIRQQMDKVKPRISLVKTVDTTIAGQHGPIPIRIYTPEGQLPFPVIVFFHGGGFVVGSLASHDNVARQLARDTKAVVVSVDYHLAPEFPFPAAVDDAYTAVCWAADNAHTFDGDASKLLVAGDSAGGNLAAVTCLVAREKNGPDIALQILLYPTTTFLDKPFASREQFLGYVLTENMVRNIVELYTPQEADRENSYASPLEAGDFHGLPPAYVMTADFDILRDEGKRYADCLTEAGVPVVYRNVAGMMHGFLSFADMVTAVPGVSRFYPQPDRVYAEIKEMMQSIFNEADAR